MTWFIVLGSSLVMIIWIPIYSLFDTVDFNYEGVILYGSVTFWATVLLTVAVAIGPRFMIRFIRSSYFPTDRDLVREMWVLGDLKKELGIAPRKQRGRKASASAKKDASMTEMAPIRKYHDRSASEATVNIGFQDDYERGPSGFKAYDYEQANTSSPADFPVRLPQTVGAGYMDAPPESSGTSTAVGSSGYTKEQELLQKDPGWKWKTDSAMSLQYVVDGDPDPTSYPVSAGAHLSPPQAARTLPMSPSPTPSYYSVSDIPAPSPMPEAQYIMPDGSVRSSTWSHSQRNTIARQGQSPDLTPTPTPTSSTFLSTPQPQSNNPYMTSYSNSQADPLTDTNAVEMRVRAPPSSFPRGMRGTGSNPYLTANSRQRSQDSFAVDSGPGSNQGHGQGGVRAESRASDVSRYATASEGGETDVEDQFYDQHAYYAAQQRGSTLSLTPRAL